MGDWWNPTTWTAPDPNDVLRETLIWVPNPIQSAYWVGAGLNAGWNALTNTPQGTINEATIAASLYNPGNVIGDLQLATHPEQIWDGGAQGGGGFQIPFLNPNGLNLVSPILDPLKDLGKWILIGGGLLAAVALGRE